MAQTPKTPNEIILSGFTYPDPDPALVTYIARVRQLVHERQPVAQRADSICQALTELSEQGVYLPDGCRCLGDCTYGRNLVYRDPNYGFTLLSMVWPAGVDAPAHDHGTWCCVGVLEGKVRVTDYVRESSQDGTLRELQTKEFGVGQSCAVIPPRTDVHKVWNPFSQDAVTLHTYGRDILVCKKFDPDTQAVEECHLGYANV